MKTLYQYATNDIYHEKARILQDMDELDSALRHLSPDKYNNMLRKLALIANAGLELEQPGMDPRVTDEILSDVSELAGMVDQALEEWITAEDVE